MYLLGEQPAYADRLINHLQGLPGQLLEGLAPCGSPIECGHNDDLGSELAAERLYLLDSGLLHARIGDKPLFYLQEGDLLGLHQGSELPPCRYSSDEPIRLIPYSRREVLAHIHADARRQELLIQYLGGHTALLGDALARLRQPEVRPTTGFRHFAAGDELIHQGDEADNVFIIVDGRADAFVDGQKVGDVQKDEIFGAMAVFTREKRSATVVASEPCTVMVIPKEQFLGLTQNNPRIAHSLIESMARRIDLLNKEVTQLRLATAAQE
ncbi:cAMP-dependent protein kinase [Stutzerimonas stutzeri TS44]|nr:cAMP-dependent protein kinase [Stutzerimonas stutzeri TS44]